LLLQDTVGLLTLTGPGGIGKTRLAMQVAGHQLDHFLDGVYFVSLAPITEPALVIAAIDQELSLQEVSSQSSLERLQDYLRERQLLLVLDNFEQVVAAAPLVAALLAKCPRLKILVTSRVPLHLYGEQEYPVPLLALPDPRRLRTDVDDPARSLRQYAAAELFVQRAQAAAPNFALTAANVATVAEICVGLDGLPLAIELAAARLKLLSPAALLAQLKQRLGLLTGGPHDAPARQRALRDEIAWSHELLAADQRTFFRRLAVFAGGFTLEAAEAVGSARGDQPVAVLDAIGALVDHSLLKRIEPGGDETRFGMLETIHEYGLERLAASGEEEGIRRRHADYFLALAEAMAPELQKQQAAALARLAPEHDNLRAALRWSQGEAGDTEIALRLAVALFDSWIFNGEWDEGRRWLEGALARSTAEEHIELRVQARLCAAYLMILQGDLAAAQPLAEEAMTIARERGLTHSILGALLVLGQGAHARHDYALASARLEEALDIARTLEDTYQTGSFLVHLGSVARDEQNYARAQSLYEQGLEFFQELGSEFEIADVFAYLGGVAQLQGEHAQAWVSFKESLRRWRAIGILHWKGIADCLEGMADTWAIERHYEQAARLFGAAEALRESLARFPTLLPHVTYEQTVAALRTQLNADAFAAAWTAGRRMTSEQVIEYALALPDKPASTPAVVLGASAAYPAGLTARELEVLQHLAQGLTYAQIADRLTVSRRTVNGHVTSIYGKLGVNGRAAATRLAVEYRLV
jgi:non-specific serine/threonine protein kinase